KTISRYPKKESTKHNDAMEIDELKDEKFDLIMERLTSLCIPKIEKSKNIHHSNGLKFIQICLQNLEKTDFPNLEKLSKLMDILLMNYTCRLSEKDIYIYELFSILDT